MEKPKLDMWMKLMALLLLFHLGFLFYISLAMHNNESFHNSFLAMPHSQDPSTFDHSLALPSQRMIIDSLETYIVHVRLPKGKVFASSKDRREWHSSFLPRTIMATEERDDRIIYSYEHAITGFAAKLTKKEVESMQNNNDVLLVQLEQVFSLQTTYTPSFLGLQQGTGLWQASNMGKGKIIGVLDSGIGSLDGSFRDDGMPSPPPKWEGQCQFVNRHCNNKVIGARSFLTTDPSDDNGHGTHVAGIAAGQIVPNANILGAAMGTASGMAPLAHIAIYKVCHNNHCPENAILQALESAIQDGVDVINFSISGPHGPFYTNSFDVGSFRAMDKGIVVVPAAGNEGPRPYTVFHEAPWYITVGATTTDRSITVNVVLGNGQELYGEGVFDASALPVGWISVVFPGANGNELAAKCVDGYIIGVSSKIVLCELELNRKGKAPSTVVKEAGGVGMILMNTQEYAFSTATNSYNLPSTYVSFLDGNKIKNYIASTSNPVARFNIKGTMFGREPALMVAGFSSRGPSLHGGLLKPDIVAPGVSILSQTPFGFDFMSGTSMAAPHISGIASLLMNIHPDWPPSVIKSALMTTADLVDRQGKEIVDQILNRADPFATGAGQVNPSKANDPGLVYYISTYDYVSYLCGLGYSDDEVEIIVGPHTPCSSIKITVEQLNHPSFYMDMSASATKSYTFTRTVTNVGSEYTYQAHFINPPGVDIKVTPSILYFSSTTPQGTYTITFTQTSMVTSPYGQGYLQWVSTSQKYLVNSQIVVKYF